MNTTTGTIVLITSTVFKKASPKNIGAKSGITPIIIAATNIEPYVAKWNDLLAYEFRRLLSLLATTADIRGIMTAPIEVTRERAIFTSL